MFNNWRAVTGGPDGIAGVPNFSIGGLQAKTSDQNYLVLLTAAILCALVVVRLRKTNLGRALSSVRDNEIAAQVMGVNAVSYTHLDVYKRQLSGPAALCWPLYLPE